MMKNIDMNSEEFAAEFKKTDKFTDKVCSTFGFDYHPEDEMKVTIQQGLTRNKLRKKILSLFYGSRSDKRRKKKRRQ